MTQSLSFDAHLDRRTPVNLVGLAGLQAVGLTIAHWNERQRVPLALESGARLGQHGPGLDNHNAAHGRDSRPPRTPSASRSLRLRLRLPLQRLLLLRLSRSSQRHPSRFARLTKPWGTSVSTGSTRSPPPSRACLSCATASTTSTRSSASTAPPASSLARLDHPEYDPVATKLSSGSTAWSTSSGRY
jgi:hypothetical protein